MSIDDYYYHLCIDIMQTLKKWFQLNRLYDINYSDQILRSIVKTTYAKKSISSLLLMLLTVVARLHIDAICGIIFNFHNIYIDFWLQIFISVILVIKSGWIYQIVERFDREVYSLTRYLINNYSEDNYRRWKRNVTFVICSYLFIYFSVAEITSSMLRIYILQYVICYVIIEIIERRYYNEVFHIFNTKTAVFTYTDDNFELIGDKKLQTNGLQFSHLVKKAQQKSKEGAHNSDSETSDEAETDENDKTNIKIETTDDDIDEQDDSNQEKSQIKRIPSVVSIQSIQTIHSSQPLPSKPNTNMFILTDNFTFNQQKMKTL